IAVPSSGEMGGWMGAALEPADCPVTPIADLSAVELIDQIEAAMDVVTEFEHSEKTGITELIDAVRARRRAWQDEIGQPRPGQLIPMVPRDDDSLINDPGTLIEELSPALHDLERRWEHLGNQDGELVEAVSMLFDAQERLSRQVEQLLRKVAELNNQRNGGQERASA